MSLRYIMLFLLVAVVSLVSVALLLPNASEDPEAAEPARTGVALRSPTPANTPEPPPNKVPEAVLLSIDEANPTPDSRQSGYLVYQHWANDMGRVETHESDPPVPWPEPLETKSSDEIVLDLGTDVIPHTVEIRVYQKLGPDGIPPGDPSETLVCETQLLSDGSCALSMSKSAANNLRLSLPSQGWDKGDHFLAIWASWFVPSESATTTERSDQNLMYDAAWIFSLSMESE